MRFRPLSALLILFTLLGASCSKRTTPVEEGIRTHTLLIGNASEPATLDPNLLDAYTDENIAVALFEGLTIPDLRTSLPVPGAAERWDISPDGRVYTFHLRPTGKWSNGDPVTAADFAYSMRRILTPALGSGYSYMLWPIKNAQAFNAGKLANFADVGVTVVDPLTLRLTLERPTPYLLALAMHNSWLPVHQATVEKFGRLEARDNQWTRPGNLVGNGAFTLTDWQPNSRIIVTRNHHYWNDAHNHLERVIFFPIENSDTEELNFRAGQLHLTYSLPASKIPVYREKSPELLRLDLLLSTNYITFNTTKPPFNNPKVRLAFALAIDREAIASNIFAGARQPAGTLVPPGCSGYVPPVGLKSDYAAARALLAEAGYPGGRGLPSFPLQTGNDDKSSKIAEALQAMWQRELGAHITIEPYEQKTALADQQALHYTAGLIGWSADFADPITFLGILTTGNGNNWTGWGNKTYDGLLDQAANTVDPTTRFAILQKAEALMLNEAPIAPFVYGARTYLINPAVKNWFPSPLGLHLYQNIELRN
ncbi:MAG: peptide ABC transporter substrate-binding protein [Opitutaceae bacterium]